MANIAIIVGHARRDTFCEALGNAYLRGASAAGHKAKLFVLAKMRFDPILHEGFAQPQPLEPDLQEATAAIKSADHLVLIWPLWMGAMPAILKGFIERVFQRGFAFEEGGPNEFPRALLKGKTARVIMTMGMPGLIYRWWYGAHALKLLKRNILRFCGIAPVASTIYGMIEAVSDDKRKSWLAEVEEMGKRAR